MNPEEPFDETDHELKGIPERLERLLEHEREKLKQCDRWLRQRGLDNTDSSGPASD